MTYFNSSTWGISPSIVAAINRLKNSNSALGIRTLQLTRSARNRTLQERYSYLLQYRSKVSRRSRLNFRSSMISRIENQVLRLELWFSTFENQESNFENWVSRAQQMYSRNSRRDFEEDYKVSSIAVFKTRTHDRSLGWTNIKVCLSGICLYSSYGIRLFSLFQIIWPQRMHIKKTYTNMQPSDLKKKKLTQHSIKQILQKIGISLIKNW